MQCMLQWIAKPSWHKVNHQNCAAACQSPSCVMCAVPFTTTFSRACMLCKWYHASSSGICHAGSYQRVSDSRPLFRHQVKVDASTGFSSSLPKSYKPDRSRRENGRTMMLTEHLQRFGIELGILRVRLVPKNFQVLQYLQHLTTNLEY